MVLPRIRELLFFSMLIAKVRIRVAKKPVQHRTGFLLRFIDRSEQNVQRVFARSISQ